MHLILVEENLFEMHTTMLKRDDSYQKYIQQA